MDDSLKMHSEMMNLKSIMVIEKKRFEAE